MKGDLTLKEIGNMFGVCKSTINNIRRKRNWAHISNEYNFPEIEVARNEKGRFYKFGSTGK